MRPEKGEKGFTLIELVITVGIIGVILGLGLLVGLDFYRGQVLDSERDNLVTLLRRARSKAMNNINQSDHGVSITASDYVIFEGPSYAGRDADFDEIFSRTAGLTLTGLSEVVFQPLDGYAGASGSIAMSDGVRNATVTINYEGRIDW